MDRYRACLSGEVLDNLHLALKDDDEVIGAIALPEKNLPRLNLLHLSVVLEELDLIVRQCRKGRASNLVGSIIHAAYSNLGCASRGGSPKGYVQSKWTITQA